MSVWWAVYSVDDPGYEETTRQYLFAMVATLIAIGASILVSDEARLLIWAAIVLFWVLGGIGTTTRDPVGFGENVTHSMVERFGLFTIVVLGEVVIGVVGGLTEAEDRSNLTIVVAMLGLAVGMGLWWNYFDALGRRVPSESGLRLATWLYVHLPLTASISAAGAAMVSLVEHAEDARTPASTAWLLGGAVALTLLCIALATRALPAASFPGRLMSQIPITLTVGAVAAVGVTALRPSPLLLAGSLLVVLSATWLWLIYQYFAAGGRPAADRPRFPQSLS